MAGTNKFKIDYATAVNISLSATSATAVLPANTQLVGVTTTANCRFRFSTAALATAVATDPLLTPNSEIQVLRIEYDVDTNVSAILDASAGTPTSPSISIFRVFEA